MSECSLFTPGPTTIPERVLDAMKWGSLHHRTAEFKEIFFDTRKRLASLMGTEPLFITGSGTAGMEAALRSVGSAEDQVLTVNAGKFGQRWGKISKAIGIKQHELCVPWGTAPQPLQLVEAIETNPGITIVCLQYSETSTAVLHPVPELSAAIKEANPEILVLVDIISAIGTCNSDINFLGADITIGGSQKALMSPPGIAFCGISERAWKRIESNTPSSLYFDLLAERVAQQKGSTAWTPAISVVLGLQEALKIIEEEGHEQVFERHKTMSECTRAAISALGLKLFPEENYSYGLTAFEVPAGIDAAEIISLLRERHSIQVAGGQNELKGKIVRIGHMGCMKPEELLPLVAALEEVLDELGVKFNHRTGIESCKKVLGL